jgi:GNAT superfamily N-acetyltransferase
MIRLQVVNAADPKVAALLMFLQLSTLTGDEPYDVNEGYWWIAYDGEMPIGFAGLVQSSRWYDTGYLCRSGVLRSHRGKGLQKRLLRVREMKARRLGWNWLISDTYQNPPSANSLIKCGFQTFTPSRPWSFDAAIYWRKKLR